MNVSLEIFVAFFKIGISTFGGGYAMLPIIEKEAVENKGWVTMAEVMDYYAISQCTPGIIAINTSTYIGYKINKLSGAIAAALGVLTPSVIIILLLSGLIQRYSALPVLEHAFSGIQVAVSVIIMNAVISMLKAGIVDRITAVIFIIALIVLLVLNVSTIAVILAAVVIGIASRRKK